MNTQKSEFALPKIQRIADTFSVGTVVRFQKILEKETLVDKAAGVKKYPVIAFSLKTTHDHFLLVGLSHEVVLPDESIKKVLKKELQATFIQQIPTSTKSQIYYSHQFDYYWYLFSPLEITQNEVEKFFSSLQNKPISIIIGYGAPILADIGEKDAHGTFEYKFFTEEYWWVEENGKIITDRWHVPKEFFSTDEIILKNIYFDHNAKHTYFQFSNGQTLVIERADELVTWHMDFPKQYFRVKLLGTGIFIQSDDISQSQKPLKKKKKKLEKSHAQEFIEKKTISQEIVEKLLVPLFELKITDVSENTGTSFCLELGEYIDETRSRACISIDGEWTLKRKTQVIASSETHAFTYLNIIMKTLLNRNAISIPSKEQEALYFSGELCLELSVKKNWEHLGLVTFFDRLQGFHISFDGENWEYTGPHDVLKRANKV